MIGALQKSWWVFLVRGILILIFGLFALFSPGAVLASLIMYLGIVAALSGLFTIIGSLFSKSEGKMSGILEGVIYLLIGILFIASPAFILTSLIYFIAIWALISGIMQIVYALKLRKVIENEWLAILSGVISIIFALVLFFNVAESANAVIMVIGVFSIISGIMNMILSFKIKGLKRA